MAHQRYTFGFTGESSRPLGEERFSPQNEADYERLARIAAGPGGRDRPAARRA